MRRNVHHLHSWSYTLGISINLILCTQQDIDLDFAYMRSCVRVSVAPIKAKVSAQLSSVRSCVSMSVCMTKRSRCFRLMPWNIFHSSFNYYLCSNTARKKRREEKEEEREYAVNRINDVFFSS